MPTAPIKMSDTKPACQRIAASDDRYMKPPAPSSLISEALVLEAAKIHLSVSLGVPESLWPTIPLERRRELKAAARASLMVLARRLSP